MRTKRAKPLSNEECVRIALEIFEGKKLKEVFPPEPGTPGSADAQMRRDIARAWRALRHAVSEGLLMVVQPPRPTLDEELGDRLRSSFRSLLGVQVVDLSRLVAQNRPKKTENAMALETGRLDDRIHGELGYAAAKWIAQGTIFQDGSTIGVGSGRGVYYTASSLRNCLGPHVLGARDVTLMSLTGFVYAKNHANDLSQSLDADLHTALLAVCFENARLYTVPFPIAHATQQALDTARRQTLLDESRWEQQKPKYALFGVGVLGPGHRLYEEAKASKHEENLTPILDPLKSLVELCDTVRAECRNPYYYPVADIANQLFYVEGPPEVASTVSAARRTKILDLIEQINGRLLTVSPIQLTAVQNVLLIAGTPTKALAIRELLLKERFNIRFLCTDKAAAAMLCN